MKAIIIATFEVDVSDWYEDERLNKKEKIKKLKEDLSDFSVFMPQFDYESLKDVEVIIKDH